MGQNKFEGRPPPYDKEAESAVLGAVLLNNDALEIVDAVLSKEDFYIESYRTIYGAMLELRGSGTPIDHVTLGQKLIRDGQLERVGGPMALDGLTDSVATVANVEHYAAIVYEQAAMRRVIYTSQTVLADAWNTRGTEEITAAVEAIVAASHGLARTRMPSKIFDLGPGVIDLYRKVAGGYRGIALPWPTLDNMTAGMWPKTLTMFVARPGVGKCQKFDTPICCARTGRYKTIRQVVQDQCDVFSRDVDGQIVPVTPDAWLYTGKKECLKVHLYSGREMSQTPEHPFMTVDGWKRTDELVVGDYVEVAGIVPQPLDAISVTEHEAILLGGMLADGSITHHCGFTKSDDGIVFAMRRAVEYFGGELIHRDGEPSCQYHAIRHGGRRGSGPNPIREVLKGLGCKMTLSREKEIPDRVFQYDNDSLAIFLGMIWGCDGSFPVSKVGHVTAEIGLASRIMVEQLQRLFLRFGVHGRVRYKPAKLNGEIFDSWVYRVYAASLGRFRDAIPIVGGKSAAVAMLKGSSNPNVDNVPMTDLLAAKLRGFVSSLSSDERARRYRVMESVLGMTTPFSVSHLYRRMTVSRRTFAAFVDAFEYEDGRHLLRNHWDRVEGVVGDGEQDVYDLTVDGTHSFVANDIVVHNTFIAVIAARYAWASGYRTLIVSPEMSKEEIAERFFVVESGVSYRDMNHGQLSDFTLPKLEKTIQDLTTAENLWIMDASDDITPNGIEAAIRACKPNLVAVDSMYDLRVKGERRDRALVALEWMKDAAKRPGVACRGIAQQNRTAELSERKGGGARLGTIALADEIGQDAHAVFALEQSKDDKDDKVLWIKPLKLRRGQILKERVGLNWDFDAMKYDEIPEAEEGYKDEEEVPF